MSYAVAFFLGLLVAAVALALGLRYARALKLVDHPEGRKDHPRSTPVIGGLGIVAAVLAVFLYRPFLFADHLGFGLGAVIIVVLGLWDDVRPIAARYKLLAQIAACCAAIGLDGVLIGQLGADVLGMPMGLGVVSAPFTLLVMLTVLNGVNLIDGVDGLAGGLSLVALALFGKAAFAAGLPQDGLIVAALIGGLGTFLCLNFPFFPKSRARTFLGDAGSLLLGFALAYFAIKLSALPHRVFKPTTALWFFAIPVFDAVWLYLRRSLYGRQPFRAGRDHLHHLLMKRWTARTVAIGLILAGAVGGGLAYLGERLNVGPFWHLAAWLLAFFTYGAVSHRPWLAEWDEARRRDAANVAAERARFTGTSETKPPALDPGPARKASLGERA